MVCGDAEDIRFPAAGIDVDEERAS